MAVDDDSLMSLGNLFHSLGPAREKDLEPADREGLFSQRRDLSEEDRRPSLPGT